MNTVVLLLGSNLGNSNLILQQACYKITVCVGAIIHKSSIFISEPWGFVHQNNFLNMALLCQTKLSAWQVLDNILKIEADMGRTRIKSDKYSARNIDIDIMFYNKEIINTENLQIPHPRLNERRFALEPLSEIIPGYIHPKIKLTVKELLEICTDKSFVKKL